MNHIALPAQQNPRTHAEQYAGLLRGIGSHPRTTGFVLIFAAKKADQILNKSLI